MYAPNSPTENHEHDATRNLLMFLSYALDLPLLEHHAAPLHFQSHDWLELLTRLFATNLRQQFHASPHRAYQSFHDDLPLLRGKLRIADQLCRPDRQHLFACTYDEFSIDNTLNRVFRFVVERLFFLTRSAPASSTPKKRRHRLYQK
jgi:5-methylcytosine-specific restriction enzyme subunit McrC